MGPLWHDAVLVDRNEWKTRAEAAETRVQELENQGRKHLATVGKLDAAEKRVEQLEAALENERIALASQGMELLPSTQAALDNKLETSPSRTGR